MISVDSKTQECIDKCLGCYKICLQTVTHCLSKGGKHAAAEHISLLMQCANICNTSANFMLLGSEYHSKTCGVCAEICEKCAESCDQLGGDESMKACAEACRSCADSCHQMAG